MRGILREEGPLGLYRGLLPSLAQVVPSMGLAFSTYETTKRHLSSRLPSTTSDVVAGALAGLVSKSVMMPMDVIRRRMQIQGSNYRAYVLSDLPVYTGIRDCCTRVWRGEGVRGFFRGLSMALLKSVPTTAVTFIVYGSLSR